jgi:hypothetical protein
MSIPNRGVVVAALLAALIGLVVWLLSAQNAGRAAASAGGRVDRDGRLLRIPVVIVCRAVTDREDR